mmetsp:Transcript_72584/g.122156  ORF Transcript_72584/g.122156 Transcript_72584/m.122156 type:complete len:201 (-) Transcript_72584:12-614(-)
MVRWRLRDGQHMVGHPRLRAAVAVAAVLPLRHLLKGRPPSPPRKDPGQSRHRNHQNTHKAASKAPTGHPLCCHRVPIGACRLVLQSVQELQGILTRAEGGLPNNRGSRPAGLRAPMGRGGGAGCHSGIGADGRGRVERGTRGQGGAQDPPEQRGGDGHGGDDGGDVPAGGGMPRARVVAALHCGVAALMGRQVESGHGAE